jgi:hypothetical protein
VLVKVINVVQQQQHKKLILKLWTPCKMFLHPMLNVFMQNGYRHLAIFGPPSWTPIMDLHNYNEHPAKLYSIPCKFKMDTCKI